MISSQSSIRSLKPIFDEQGLIRGRLSDTDMTNDEKHPLIILAKHHISTLLINQYHENVVHQECHFTEGAIHTIGLWVIRAKKRLQFHQRLYCL